MAQRGSANKGNALEGTMVRSFRHSLEKETKHNGSTKSRSVAKDPGPSNTVLDAKNPDSMLPPVSDAGAVPTFKYPVLLRPQATSYRRAVSRSYGAGTRDRYERAGIFHLRGRRR